MTPLSENYSTSRVITDALRKVGMLEDFEDYGLTQATILSKMHNAIMKAIKAGLEQVKMSYYTMVNPVATNAGLITLDVNALIPDIVLAETVVLKKSIRLPKLHEYTLYLSMLNGALRDEMIGLLSIDANGSIQVQLSKGCDIIQSYENLTYQAYYFRQPMMVVFTTDWQTTLAKKVDVPDYLCDIVIDYLAADLQNSKVSQTSDCPRRWRHNG